MRKCTRDELFKLANGANLNPPRARFRLAVQGRMERLGNACVFVNSGFGIPHQFFSPVTT